MGNKSRRRARVSGPSVKPPPRAANWIFTGNGRGYYFANLDNLMNARAQMGKDGEVQFIYSNDQLEGGSIYGRTAEDVIAHLVMVGIDVTGAAEVLRDRLKQDIRETLQALYVLEDDQLEPFHRGEIGIESGEDAGAAGELRKCRLCGCTEFTPCVDPNGAGPGEEGPCHWIEEDLCSSCKSPAERLEQLSEGQKKFTECNSCVHAGNCFTLKDHDRPFPCMMHVPNGKPAPATCHDPATPCAHDEKEECDGCNDCGGVFRGLEKADGVISPLDPPLGKEERPRVLSSSARQTPEPHPDPEVDAMIDRLHNSIGKPTNCLDCLNVDQPSCTWSNGGPAPCPGFERDPAGKNDADRVFMKRSADPPGVIDIVGTSADRARCWYGAECHRFPRCLGCSLRNLRDRTSPARPADVLEVTGKTSEELIERVRTCGVFRGLQQRGALFGKDYCNVGHEMKEPACACCEYLRIASSDLAPGHEAHDLAGGRSGGTGGESDRDR